MNIQDKNSSSINRSIGCFHEYGKIGILIAQLGTPDQPTPKFLRKYLKQFLADRRIIEVNKVLWWFLLNFIILTFRPFRSAKLYKRIWFKEGSPLKVYTEAQAKKLQEHFEKTFQNEELDVSIAIGMRYANPSIPSQIDYLVNQKKCTRILVFPMYPQYSATTSASIYDEVFDTLKTLRNVPTIKFIEPFYNQYEYLYPVTSIFNDYLEKAKERPEKIVLSYHGIPVKYVSKGDSYCCMCTETTGILKNILNFPSEDIIHTFQSRFGKDPWLQPYTDEMAEKLAKEEKVKHIAVLCPGFTADCLETLDEMGNELEEEFKEHGGEKVDLIPCVNDNPLWIRGMFSLVLKEIYPWIRADENSFNYQINNNTLSDKILSIIKETEKEFAFGVAKDNKNKDFTYSKKSSEKKDCNTECQKTSCHNKYFCPYEESTKEKITRILTNKSTL